MAEAEAKSQSQKELWKNYEARQGQLKQALYIQGGGPLLLCNTVNVTSKLFFLFLKKKKLNLFRDCGRTSIESFFFMSIVILNLMK